MRSWVLDCGDFGDFGLLDGTGLEREAGAAKGLWLLQAVAWQAVQ